MEQQIVEQQIFAIMQQWRNKSKIGQPIGTFPMLFCCMKNPYGLTHRQLEEELKKICPKPLQRREFYQAKLRLIQDGCVTLKKITGAGFGGVDKDSIVFSKEGTEKYLGEPLVEFLNKHSFTNDQEKVKPILKQLFKIQRSLCKVI